MQMFAPLQAPQIARGLSPQTATCRGSYASAHQASWQVCEHSSCCTSSAPVSAYCATAPPVLHVMPARMGCVGHIPQTWSEICCRASGSSISQAGRSSRLSGTLLAGLSALIVDRKGTCVGAHHARVALCKLLHLVLQGLCGVHVIHGLHLRTRLSLRLRTQHCVFCPSCQQMTESAPSTACRPQPCSLCHRLQRQLLTCQVADHLERHRPAAGLQGILIRPRDAADLVRHMEPRHR